MKILNKTLEKYSNCEFIDIEKIINNFGINIDYFDFKKINGIVIEKDICVNKNLSKKKQRFTLAHELCHFLLKEKGASTGFFSSSDFREKRADDFATNLLLPKNAFLENWERFQNIPTLADIFGVPKKAIEMRLKNLIK